MPIEEVVDGLLLLFVGHMGVAPRRELEGVGGSCPLSSIAKQKCWGIRFSHNVWYGDWALKEMRI